MTDQTANPLSEEYETDGPVAIWFYHEGNPGKLNGPYTPEQFEADEYRVDLDKFGEGRVVAATLPYPAPDENLKATLAHMKHLVAQDDEMIELLEIMAENAKKDRKVGNKAARAKAKASAKARKRNR